MDSRVRILITGGTGLIGSNLIHDWLATGHRVTVLSRSASSVHGQFSSRVAAIERWSHLRGAGPFDAVVNLAGAPIAAHRWTEARKVVLRRSRIEWTQRLVQSFEHFEQPPAVLVQASASGYYGDQGDLEITEATTPIEDFAHHLCADWERAGMAAEALGVRVVRLRLGAVLSEAGGLLKPLLPLCRMGGGAVLGDGRQWLAWLHREDVVRIVNWALLNTKASGAFNACAPTPIPQQVFVDALAEVLHRPRLLRIPAAPLRLLLGERANLVLASQRMVPTALTSAQFQFRHPELSAALRDLLHRP
ncbi:MAG: TIGR01777 family oxidoreductase [Pseudomonadota bacterium]|nr:TIGR01777 family oxidoreductase [Pseudomonadota bacterium]